MSSFTEPLEVRQLEDGERWSTLRTISYWTDCAEGDEDLHLRCASVFSIPAGFITDFASIPRPLWSVIGHPAGRYAQAAVLHDWLYRCGQVSRSRADAIFREAMEVLGVPTWQRWAMWAAVRIGGRWAYAAARTVP